MKKNNSIIEFENLMYSNSARFAKKRVIRPSNFWDITSFPQRFRAAMKVLYGRACAVPWYDIHQIHAIESIEFIKRVKNAEYTPGDIHKMWNGPIIEKETPKRIHCANCLHEYSIDDFIECPKCAHPHKASHICDFGGDGKCKIIGCGKSTI